VSKILQRIRLGSSVLKKIIAAIDVKAQDKICEEEEIQDYGFSSIIIATFC
jgi:hypothetical protein